MELRNKIALVTGGSRGLGKNTALRLAEKGADVIITYHQQKEAADAVVEEIEKRYQRTAVALQLDVSLAYRKNMILSPPGKAFVDLLGDLQSEYMHPQGLGLLMARML